MKVCSLKFGTCLSPSIRALRRLYDFDFAGSQFDFRAKHPYGTFSITKQELYNTFLNVEYVPLMHTVYFDLQSRR